MKLTLLYSIAFTTNPSNVFDAGMNTTDFFYFFILSRPAWKCTTCCFLLVNSYIHETFIRISPITIRPKIVYSMLGWTQTHFSGARAWVISVIITITQIHVTTLRLLRLSTPASASEHPASWVTPRIQHTVCLPPHQKRQKATLHPGRYHQTQFLLGSCDAAKQYTVSLAVALSIQLYYSNNLHPTVTVHFMRLSAAHDSLLLLLWP